MVAARRPLSRLPVHNAEPGRQIDEVLSFVSSLIRRTRHTRHPVSDLVAQALSVPRRYSFAIGVSVSRWGHEIVPKA